MFICGRIPIKETAVILSADAVWLIISCDLTFVKKFLKKHSRNCKILTTFALKYNIMAHRILLRFALIDVFCW